MAEIGVELDCLEGIKVVDFTQFEAGPSCTESLAWLGAEVVKIENPAVGDPGRRLKPGGIDDDPWYFHQFNANKKSLTLNLKSPRGLEIVRALLKKADVTVENMAPGTIERLGLGYDAVKEINPGIIYCQVKGFGTGSPYEKSLAFDMIAQAAGGPISVTGEGDRAPVKTRPELRRYRHRHADGDQHPGRALPADQDWPGAAPAGGDAGCDDPLHAHAVLPHPAERPSSATQRQQPVQPRPRPFRPLPVQGGRAERLRLYLHQPCQSRSLASPLEGDRTRGPDRRRALRHRPGARPARGRGR